MIKVKTKTKVVEEKKALNIEKQLAILAKRPYVLVGVLAEDASERKLTRGVGDTFFKSSSVKLIDVAIKNEFGSKRIPERSFLRSTFDEQKSSWFKTTDKLRTKVYSGRMDVLQALGIIGLQMEIDIKKKINSGIPPANSQGMTLSERVKVL